MGKISHESEKKGENHSDHLSQRFIEFTLGKEDYAIPLLMVKEVISPPETTEIPKSPNYFKGIMNLRGQIISILDLRIKLGIKALEEKEENAVIIVDIGKVNVGVIVDSINKVFSFTSDEVNQIPEVGSQIQNHYILGVYRKEEGLTIFLDIAKILNLKEINYLIDNPKEAA